jgi:hypothetical protein
LKGRWQNNGKIAQIQDWRPEDQCRSFSMDHVKSVNSLKVINEAEGKDSAY